MSHLLGVGGLISSKQIYANQNEESVDKEHDFGIRNILAAYLSSIDQSGLSCLHAGKHSETHQWSSEDDLAFY